MNIYFRTNSEINNIYDLLVDGFSTMDGKFKITYYDLELTSQECHSARRSFEDLLSICQTYFPETSEKELAKTLLEINNNIGLYSIYCSDIEKAVFRRNSGAKGKDYFITNFLTKERDEKGRGEYSINEILNLMES